MGSYLSACLIHFAFSLPNCIPNAEEELEKGRVGAQISLHALFTLGFSLPHG